MKCTQAYNWGAMQENAANRKTLPCTAHRELRALDGLGAALVHDGAVPQHAERQPRLQSATGDAAAGNDAAAGVPIVQRGIQHRCLLWCFWTASRQ